MKKNVISFLLVISPGLLAVVGVILIVLMNPQNGYLTALAQPAATSTPAPVPTSTPFPTPTPVPGGILLEISCPDSGWLDIKVDFPVWFGSGDDRRIYPPILIKYSHIEYIDEDERFVFFSWNSKIAIQDDCLFWEPDSAGVWRYQDPFSPNSP